MNKDRFDSIWKTVFPEETAGLRPDRGFQILYRDEAVMVCRKEPGMPVQSAKLGTVSMESALRTLIREDGGQYVRENGTDIPYLGVVHRLDQPVGGLVVFALTPAAADSFAKQIADRTVEKIYLAGVQVTDAAGREAVRRAQEQEVHLTHLLLRDPKTNRSRIIAQDGREAKAKGARRAELYFRCLAVDEMEERALLSIRLVTGRHHQIRVQLSGSGLPIIGDRKYHPAQDNGGRMRFPALRACALTFRHPVTGQTMHFVLPEAEEALKL